MSTYTFRSGAHIRAALDAQAVGEELERLRSVNGEGFNTATVVDAARPESSPLHAHFTWDITGEEAQQRVWEQEAAYLIRSVIVITPEEPAAPPVPAFVSVVTRAQGEREYLPTVRALTDEEYRQQVLGEAIEAFVALRRRYRDLNELASVFAAIDALTGVREPVAV